MEKKNLILLICTVLSFFAVFAVNSVMVVIPTIASEFHMSNIVQNWAIIIFLLVVAVLSVPAGQISGKYGLKKVTIISVILFILISVANVLVTSSEQFLLCRLVLGIALSFFNVTSMAMVVSAFKPEERGKALGITITGVYIALSMAPVLGGILNYHLGWRSVVLFGVPFLLVILALLLTKVDEEWITFEGVPFDVKGSFTYGIGMVLFIYGFTILNEPLGVILTLVGIVVLAIFAMIELRQDYPVFDVRFFKNRKFFSANFASLCAYLATFAVTTILNYHLQYIKGLDSQTAGIILLAAPLCQVVLAPIAGRLSDKYVPQVLAAIGMGLGTVSLVLFSFLNEATSLEFLIVAMIIWTVFTAEYKCHNEFRSAKGHLSGISGRSNNAYCRSGNEFGNTDTGICIRDGQCSYCGTVLSIIDKQLSDNMFNLCGVVHCISICFICRNQVRQLV